MKKIIIILGMPGAGKSTLSRLIQAHTIFKHVEFDTCFIYEKGNDNIIFDSFLRNTEDLLCVIEEYKDYQITLINLNVDKRQCLKNIQKRNRPTIDVTDVNVKYDFESIGFSHKFDLIQVNNSVIDKEHSKSGLNTPLFDHLCSLLKINYSSTRNIPIVRRKLHGTY